MDLDFQKKICLVDDSVAGVGGTSLTLDAIIEPNKEGVELIPTTEFSLKDVFSYDFFIFGNIVNFTPNSLDAVKLVLEQRKFVKIEFDYGYCKFRGEVPHQKLGGCDCDCREFNHYFNDLYDLIRSNALHIFYMSKEQMSIHDNYLNKIDDDKKSVLSSCFTKENLEAFKKLKKKKKNNKYAIIDGNGGWHTEAKGISKSIEYAKQNNLEYDLIKTKTHPELLEILSTYKGLITLPIIHDTCPRVTIEARFMGLDLITNDFSQHITEEWWKSDDESAFNFTKSRPKYFWEKIKCLK